MRSTADFKRVAWSCHLISSSGSWCRRKALHHGHLLKWSSRRCLRFFLVAAAAGIQPAYPLTPGPPGNVMGVRRRPGACPTCDHQFRRCAARCVARLADPRSLGTAVPRSRWQHPHQRTGRPEREPGSPALRPGQPRPDRRAAAPRCPAASGKVAGSWYHLSCARAQPGHGARDSASTEDPRRSGLGIVCQGQLDPPEAAGSSANCRRPASAGTHPEGDSTVNGRLRVAAFGHPATVPLADVPVPAPGRGPTVPEAAF